MFLSKRRAALLSALSAAALAGTIGMATLPASAATAIPARTAAAPAVNTAAVPAAIGSILCSGDLCIQTISANITTCVAVVAAWADTSNFTGHFEIAVPDELYVQNSTGGDRVWIAGGANYKFTVPFFGEGETYQVSAWRHNSNGSYTRIGFVQFGINVPSFC
jgi:hypothetical protein